MSKKNSNKRAAAKKRPAKKQTVALPVAQPEYTNVGILERAISGLEDPDGVVYEYILQYTNLHGRNTSMQLDASTAEDAQHEAKHFVYGKAANQCPDLEIYNE